MRQFLYRKLIAPIVSAHDSPEAVAGGVAIGVAIGMTPTLGVQMPIAWLVATLCGANRIVAMALVWISNPLTAIPLFYGQYVLGGRLLDRTSLSSFRDFSDAWSGMAELRMLDRLRTLSDTVAFPLLTGSLTCALAFGALAYPITLIALRRRRLRLARALPAECSTATESSPEAGAEEARSPDLPRHGLPFGLLLCLGLLSSGALVGCAEDRTPLSRPGVPEESTSAETVRMFVGRDEARGLVALLVDGAEFPGGSFGNERLRERLGPAAEDRPIFRLELLHLGPGEELVHLGADGVRLRTVPGSSLSLSPSEVLKDGSADPLVASRLGLGPLPDLPLGSAVRIDVVLSETPRGDVELELPGGALALEPCEVGRSELDAFRADPRANPLRTTPAGRTE